MRQSNGSELFGANDPRSTTIGIINVAPDDDRASILAAILTQDKLGRKQTVLVMPDGNKAFRRAVDFEGFNNTLDGLQTQLVFVSNKETQLTKFARQHQLLVFRSLENYAGYVKTFLKQDVDREGAEGGHDKSVPTETQTPPQVFPPPAPPAPVAVEREMPQWILPPSPTTAREDEATRPLPPTIPPPPPSPIPEEPVTPGAEGQVKDQLAKDQREQIKTRNGSNEAQAGPQPIILVPSDEEQEPLDEEPKPVLVPPPPRPHTLSPVPPSQLRTVRSRSGRLRLIAVLLLLILLLLGSAYLSVLVGIGPLGQFFPGSAATVTITAGSKDLKQTYTVSAITGAPDASKNQVAARFLSMTTPEQAKTEPVSGIGIRPATLASGMLTFYNALSQAQTVAAGTVFTDSKGIQVVSDQAIEIPAATPPLEGSAAVSAHAVMVGARGNIAALDFQTFVCCHAGITATNTQAFSGGQDQQTYTYVEQRDIDTIADTLFIPLQASGQQAVQKQLLPNEQFVGTTKCSRNVSASPPAGDQTTNVTVSETVTCVAEAFDQQGAQSLAASLLKADALKNPGASYALLGHIATTVTGAQPQDTPGTILLHVTAQGRWGAQFDDVHKQKLARMIAGQNAGTAQDLLLRQVGVSQASIAVSGSIGNVLPTDERRITIISK